MEQLQTAYYIIGIVFMILYGLLLIGIVIFIFFMWKKIRLFINTIDKRIHEAKKYPEEVASTIGSTLATTAFEQIKKMFQRSKEE